MSRRRGRGGKGGREPRARIKLRELEVLAGIRDGRTQHQIAKDLGISQPAVSKIAGRLEARLLNDLAWRIERQRARHTIRLEHVFRESMSAWYASKEDRLRRRQRKTNGGAAEGSVAELISENRHGDPRYLEQARKSLAELRTLWGVDAPERIAIEPSALFSSMSDTALEAELSRQQRLLSVAPPPVNHDVPVPIPPKEDDHDRA